MDKSVRQMKLRAKPSAVLFDLGRTTVPLSENERKVLMRWHNGDVTVGEILAHRVKHRLPFGVVRGGLPYKRRRPETVNIWPSPGGEAA